ncbi:MAG: DUF697 domain-containing protein [Acaryochloridaceae cyanobacterium RU_4_10]|nr:DUF697 domain-containing protein [Acaryochloridaceae cyanobacterium RU_4_10]
MRSEFNTERDSSETSNAQQQLARERAMVCVRDLLARHQRSPIELKAQLQPYLETLGGLQQKLSQPLIQIAVFGLVSRGKSAVLNALFGETIFPTGPLSGVTQWPRSVRWSPVSTQESAPSVQLELIDTPGLDEISGEARASMAQEIARCADLILFVTAGPPLPMEEEAIAELAQFMKPLLWVVNKADLYPELTSETLHASLANPTLQAILSPSEIVLTSAAPAPVQVRHEWPDGRVTVDWETPPPQVDGLRQTLVDLLNREGLYLLSLNALRQVRVTEKAIIEAIATFYAEPVQSMQWRLWGIKAAFVSIIPWGWLDLVLSFGMDLVQVRRLMQVYGLPVTGHQVGSLWQRLLVSLGMMGAAELTTLGLLDGTPVASVAIQAAIAIYSASLVGQTAQRVLLDGATWDAQGPSLLIQNMLDELDPNRVVSRLSGAIAPHPESAQSLPESAETLQKLQGPSLIDPSKEGS